MKTHFGSIAICCVMAFECGIHAQQLLASSGVSLRRERLATVMYGVGAGQPQDAGQHGSNHLTALNFEFVFPKLGHELCLRLGALAVWKFDLNGEDSDSEHDFTDLGVLYGRSVFFGRWAFLHASLGAALVSGETYKGGNTHPGDGPQADRFVTVGAPWSVTAAVTPLQRVGLGLTYWGNMNAKNSFTGWSIVTVVIVTR